MEKGSQVDICGPKDEWIIAEVRKIKMSKGQVLLRYRNDSNAREESWIDLRSNRLREFGLSEEPI